MIRKKLRRPSRLLYSPPRSRTPAYHVHTRHEPVRDRREPHTLLGWVVRADGRSKAYRLFRSKSRAVAFARKRFADRKLYVHRMDGSISRVYEPCRR